MAQYYAITKYGTIRSAPFALVRFDRGIFEEFRAGRWVETDRYDDILIGDSSDYEVVSAEEARAIQQKMMV